ncbi:organic cation transporter protein-like [Haliotis rubra]|uniref:organic cation transporter protein-like n=1 Tax=Haliotis rubra TaxID=36100 RepID=UPI001EE53E30|nr:organic cation transporter protein-like [Haliotis rubra]
MKFDEVLLHLGEFGRYQKRLYFVLCILTFMVAMQSQVVIFQLDTPNHRRAVMSQSWMPEDPSGLQTKRHGTVMVDKCFFTNHSLRATCTTRLFNNGVDEQLIARTSRHRNNAVGEYKRASEQQEEMVGNLLSHRRKRFGRRPLVLISSVVKAIVTISMAFVPNVYVYMAFRALASVCGIAAFTSSLVLMMELTGPSRRVFVGVVVEIFWCFSQFTLGLIAYFVRNWQTLQLITAFPLVPESPRWLIARGRIPEAQTTIQKMASVNGVEFTEEMAENITVVNEKQKTVRVTQMFSTPYLLFITLIIFFNWFVASLAYYGLNLNVQNLSGNIYLNFTISNTVELVSYITCMLLLDRLGRKFVQSGCLLLGGIACVCTMFPVIYGNSDWMTVVLAMIGKLGASGIFATVYVYTTELFPTVIRNSGLGVSSFFARIGGMVSPYIADLGVLLGGDMKVALPLIVFGGLSIAAGLLTLFLPETLKRRLPETIEDAKNMRKKCTKTKSERHDKTTDVEMESFQRMTCRLEPSEEI